VNNKSAPIPGSLETGDYELAIGVVESATGAPVIRLAIAGRGAGGWYPVSDFEVSKPE
jgi:hypothetical protein